ncbi:LacI family DNA-binding transcriptional regulator [Promicromonospora kroppenstedtii]|uniref:LacI family DNA-binding transcriptional regulator n=1 Tax=Promicromonospora kroppenstedtii TaxID=440482 RepID=A0ABW7XDF6_9MICO|nr:LacI family DNA-binding transcriptional regulator [Promicromonospora kroppenstedtii]
MRVTLRHVAERAGVSFKTVSNVINGHPNVRPETRERVESAIAELRYRPNTSARSLRHGRAGFLAIALPELTSPYFAGLASELAAAARAVGQSVLIEETSGDLAGERAVLDGLPSHLVDGVFFSPLVTPVAEVVERRDGTPLVLLGEYGEPAGVDHVGVDNVAAARDVTRHLLDLGRRRIAGIGLQSGAGTGRLRGEGYLAALAEAGVPADPDLVVECTDYHRASGADAVTQLLARGVEVDAVFCFNDLMALGALRALHEHGLRVPQDVAVAGFDGIEDGQFSVPSLTTVTPDLPLLAAEAVRLVMRRIAEPDAPAEHVVVPHAITARESTGPGPHEPPSAA